jgi:hypothetical protein
MATRKRKTAAKKHHHHHHKTRKTPARSKVTGRFLKK